MLEAFREDPKEYSRDLAMELEQHGAKKPGIISRRWHGGRIERKLEILREYLPPHQQQMFALRDFCYSDSGVKHRIRNLTHKIYGWSHANFLATAIGYATPAGGCSPISAIPSTPSTLHPSVKVFNDRTAERGLHSRDELVMDRLHKQAQLSKVQLEPAGMPLSLDVRRTLFRVKLMQTLVHDGYTPRVLQSLGMSNHAHRILAKHQVGNGQNPDAASKIEIGTVNHCLRMLASFDDAQELARDFFHLYAQDAISGSVGRACDLNAIADEEDGISDTKSSHRGIVEMLARAIGIRNLQKDDSLKNPTSDEYKELSRLIGELGLTEHRICNTVNVARSILHARKLFHPVIWFGAVTQRGCKD